MRRQSCKCQNPGCSVLRAMIWSESSANSPGHPTPPVIQLISKMSSGSINMNNTIHNLGLSSIAGTSSQYRHRQCFPFCVGVVCMEGDGAEHLCTAQADRRCTLSISRFPPCYFVVCTGLTTVLTNATPRLFHLGWLIVLPRLSYNWIIVPS